MPTISQFYGIDILMYFNLTPIGHSRGKECRFTPSRLLRRIGLDINRCFNISNRCVEW
jgi:hypothetical protein